MTHLTDGTGNLVEKYQYDVFGNPVILSPTNQRRTASIVSNRFMFTGREFSNLFGFYEYRARAYNPLLGRFMSEDPIGLQIAGQKPSVDALSRFPIQLPKALEDSEINLFRYCHNDPLNKLDPFGLLEFEFDPAYPKSGYQAFRDAKALVYSTERGRQLIDADPGRKIIIKPADATHPTSGSREANTIRLDAKDPAFLDAQSRRDFKNFPDEAPPSNAKGRAVTLAHELGHVVTGQKDENKGGHNVRDNENPVRRDLKLPDRDNYKGIDIHKHFGQ